MRRAASRTRLALVLVAAVLVLAACGSQVTITALEERWCRSDIVSLSEDAVGAAFAELHDVSLGEAKASYGYNEGSAAQVGSRMTITDPEGFPTVEDRNAWFDSDEYVQACRAAYDAYN
ncbi:MAG: hypothetical protein HKN93_03035 [Acidimicrobiia bacterium]|nr:hypothetical protein [Acidimicrobiia bacterium]